MDIEIIAIGDEVLYGYTINSNAAYIAQELLKEGFLVTKHLVVADDKTAVQNAVQDGLLRGSFIIVTGGLGPTLDDCTRAYIVELFHRELVLRQDILDDLKRRFPQDQVTLYNQAFLPDGADRIDNPIGTASGFFLQDQAFPGMVVCLPGVPREMHEMLPSVLKILQKRIFREKRLFVEMVHFFLLTEPEVAVFIEELSKEYKGVFFGIYPKYGSLTVHLKTYAFDQKEAEQKIAPVKLLLKNQYEKNRIESDSGDLVEALHDFFIEKSYTVATAESCTGGALASAFTALADSSKYFQGGIVAYSNLVKQKELFVLETTLEKEGAVSEEVAIQMAKGVQEKFSVDIAFGITGILGPSGGSEKKPIGTICMAIAFFDRIEVWTKHFSGKRETIKQKAMQNILGVCYSLVKQNSF